MRDPEEPASLLSPLPPEGHMSKRQPVSYALGVALLAVWPLLTRAAHAASVTKLAAQSARVAAAQAPAMRGVPEPIRVCRGLPEHMDIAFRSDKDGHVLTDKASVTPPDGYEFWYMINSETVKTPAPLSNYVYRSAMPLTIYKAMVRKGTANLYPANQDDMAMLSSFSRNTSVAFLSVVFRPAAPSKRTGVAWESLIPSGYDPSSGFVQWADAIEDMQLPRGKIWVSGRGQWPAAQMYRKGLTHLTKFDLAGLPQREIDAYMRQGKAYDDVPTTPVQLSLKDKGSGEWVPKGQSWPNIWNTRFFPYKEGQTEPLTREQGAEIGRSANTAYSLVIFENSEQDHAVGGQWPFWRSYYGEWMPRMEAAWKPRGVQHYVGHNYFSGILPSLDWMQRGPAKEFLRKPLSQWGSPMLPGGTLEKSNLSCFGLYLGAPDLVKDFHYRLIFAAYANHKAGKHMVGFMQAVHEWRPNNFYENILPEGTFYRQEKLPPAPGATLGLAALAFVFGDGFIPFGFGGKRDTKKWVRHYAQGALWYPKGADQPADLDTFPFWCPESGGYYIGYSGVEDMTAFAVRAVHRTFFRVEGGEARFLSFRIDGGPWIEAQNAEADDVVDACYDKRGLVFSKRKGAQMAVLYINPYADNAPHILEFKDAQGRSYKAAVSTSAPHLALI